MTVETTTGRQHLYLIVVCSAALASRLLLDGIQITPDGNHYLHVAHNLASNLSLGAPGWEGLHQPPGYPLFIAAVGLLFGFAPLNVVVAQSVIFSLALWYLLLCAARLKPNFILLILSGLAIALSPSIIGISRWIFTETLASAATLWLLAECCNSMSTRRISTLRTSAAIAACVLIRWDMIWTVVLLAVVAYWLYAPREAIKKWFLICSLSFIPYAALAIRAVLLGITIVPPTLIATSEEVPEGVVSFWRTTAVTQSATANFLWAVWGRQYKKVLQDPNSFFLEDPGRYSSLFESLASLPDGKPVPPELDSAFSEAARRISIEGGIEHRLKILGLRIYNLWVSDDRVFKWFYLTDAQPYTALQKLARYERIFYLCLLFLCVAFTMCKTYRVLATAVLLMVMARTVFLALFTALEIRYFVALLPSIQFAAIALWSRREKV